jgi:signal transduction histidine kinase
VKVRPSRGGTPKVRVSLQADAEFRAAVYGRGVPRLRPFDWIPAVLLGLCCVYEIWVGMLVAPGFPGPRGAETAAAGLLVAGVALRRVAPLRALALVVVSVVAQVALNDDPTEYQPSFEAFMALLLTCYSVVLHAERVRALQALVLVFVLPIGSALVRPSRAAVEDMFGMFVLLALLWAVASVVRARQERITELELAQERDAEVAVSAERARIARELHDIVAHAVSVMVVQIGGARHSMRTKPDVAEESMRLAEAAGREALNEMRRLVGLMREDTATTEPTPGVESLTALVERFTAAGLPVELDIEPGLPDLPAGTDLAAYRVVQEGLTNALKHAGKVQTGVSLRRAGDRLQIAVRNAGGTAVNGHGGGHGLMGLRERVALYGGRMTAGRDGHGFVLEVELPL